MISILTLKRANIDRIMYQSLGCIFIQLAIPWLYTLDSDTLKMETVTNDFLEYQPIDTPAKVYMIVSIMMPIFTDGLSTSRHGWPVQFEELWKVPIRSAIRTGH